MCGLNEIDQNASIYISFYSLTHHALTHRSAVCVIQKHAAALCVPGAPGVFRISASAHSAPVRRSLQCVEVTAPPTTTSASSTCPPACRRGELMWRSAAAVMKVGNGLWNGVIMLTNRPLKWCNYLYQLTCATVFSHLDFHNGCICHQQHANRLWKMNWKSYCMSINTTCYREHKWLLGD